jgi:hypothetical protein
MDEILANIKEIQECRKNNANWYLDHGYILLEIQALSRATLYPETNVGQQGYYVSRHPIYILGRPDGVEAAPPPPRRQPNEAGGQGNTGETKEG